MNVWGFISIGFLAIMVLLVLLNIRGHKGSGEVDAGLGPVGTGGGDQADGG